MRETVRLHAERTPNPDSLRWVLSTALVPEGVRAHFAERPGPEVSPLAESLFPIEGVASVLLTADFVAVSKRPGADWARLGERVTAAIRSFVASGRPALGPRYGAAAPDAGPADAAPESGGDLAERIRAFLDREIRPVVAADGGDVELAGLRDGVVELILRGACSGCPSSTATLRLGIEARLREAVPEVSEVVAVARDAAGGFADRPA